MWPRNVRNMGAEILPIGKIISAMYILILSSNLRHMVLKKYFGKKSQEQFITILRAVFKGRCQKTSIFHFPFFSPRHAQQCYSRVGIRVGGMYGMNNKYSIEHPVTWKAIQGRQGKIVILPRYFLLFLFPTSTSETFFFKKRYVYPFNQYFLNQPCLWMNVVFITNLSPLNLSPLPQPSFYPKI